MKKIWKIRKDKEGVSPVIATILMVAITVVLAAVLYVMVMGIGGFDDVPQPLGLNDGGQTSTSMIIMITTAPDNAYVEGTTFSLTSGTDITSIANATLYDSNGLETAWFTPLERWNYGSGSNADNLKYLGGMKLKILVPEGISNGDQLTISSENEHFLATEYVV